MKYGVMLINIGCGGFVDVQVLVDVFKSGQFGYFGFDVYEEESGLFFEDYFDLLLQDDVFVCLLMFLNVIVMLYQVFFMCEVLVEIVYMILLNIEVWYVGVLQNVVMVNC